MPALLKLPRYAAIDVGTNSVLLTIAQGSKLQVIEQYAEVTRLGQGVDRTRELHPDAMQRTLECLRRYRQALDRHAPLTIRAVGTSALRDAGGGSAFTARATEVLGVELEVVSGQREAQLTFVGALHELPVTGDALVFDIGGGSTELILGNVERSEISFCTSLDIGSVRLTERLGLSDPPSREQLGALQSSIDQALTTLPAEFPEAVTVVGVAGTVTTLCAVSQRLAIYDSSKVHGQRMDARTVRALADQLAQLSVEQRLALPGLTPGRADVIAAGAALCATLLERAGQSTMLVSDRGVRYGLLRELAR